MISGSLLSFRSAKWAPQITVMVMHARHQVWLRTRDSWVKCFPRVVARRHSCRHERGVTYHRSSVTSACHCAPALLYIWAGRLLTECCPKDKRPQFVSLWLGSLILVIRIKNVLGDSVGKLRWVSVSSCLSSSISSSFISFLHFVLNCLICSFLFSFLHFILSFPVFSVLPSSFLPSFISFFLTFLCLHFIRFLLLLFLSRFYILVCLSVLSSSCISITEGSGIVVRRTASILLWQWCINCKIYFASDETYFEMKMTGNEAKFLYSRQRSSAHVDVARTSFRRWRC